MTTTTNNQGLILPAQGDLNDVPTHLGLYNDGVESRLVQRFTSSVDRGVRNPSPNEGELSYLSDTNRLYYHDGSSWIPLVGSWQTYAPSLIASSGTTALGASTLSGRYMQVGKTVHFKLKLTAGTGLNFGTGNSVSFSLPVTRSTSIDDVFPAILIDASASTPGYRVAQGLAFASDSFIVVTHEGTTGIVISGLAQPWTWAPGDMIRVSGTYEAA